MHWYYWLIIVICMLFSAFFSSADMVYGIVDQDKLEKEAEAGSKRAKVALKIAKDYNLSIATILFGNNIVNILASSIVTLIGIYLTEVYKVPGELLGTIVLTVAIIIFSEFIPKAFAKRFNYKLSLIFAYPVSFFVKLFFIIVWPISQFFNLFGRLFKKKADEEDIIDEEVLTEMVDTIEEEGILEEEEAEIVRGAIDLSDSQAFEIMTPRVDVYSIDINDDINALLKEDEEEFFIHSRIPVYEDTVDNIIGILPLKSLSKYILNNEEIDDIRPLLYKPLVIPRSYPILSLLSDFRESKIHIAVVIDEYGGVEGIITMEDLLEEIVGDIFDETDEIEEEVEDIGNGIYIVDGSMNIDDFFDLIEYEEEVETDYATIGGFCQEILERFAKTGDTFVYANHKFTVLDADEFVVIKLKVETLPMEE